ncbi:unnamed protein product [Lampetra planeri]
MALLHCVAQGDASGVPGDARRVPVPAVPGAMLTVALSESLVNSLAASLFRAGVLSYNVTESAGGSPCDDDRVNPSATATHARSSIHLPAASSTYAPRGGGARVPRAPRGASRRATARHGCAAPLRVGGARRRRLRVGVRPWLPPRAAALRSAPHTRLARPGGKSSAQFPCRAAQLRQGPADRTSGGRRGGAGRGESEAGERGRDDCGELHRHEHRC